MLSVRRCAVDNALKGLLQCRAVQTKHACRGGAVYGRDGEWDAGIEVEGGMELQGLWGVEDRYEDTQDCVGGDSVEDKIVTGSQEGKREQCK